MPKYFRTCNAKSFFKQLNIYGFERKGQRYPAYYNHKSFEQGNYGDLVQINRRHDSLGITEIEIVDTVKLAEEVQKLDIRCRELEETSNQLREEISQNIQCNKSMITDNLKFRREFCENTKLFLIYFCLKISYLDTELISESETLLKEQLNIGIKDHEQYMNKCAVVSAEVSKYMQQLIFYSRPISDFCMKSLNAAMNAMKKHLKIENHKNWSTKALMYMFNGNHDGNIHSLQGFKEIDDVRLFAEDALVITFNSFFQLDIRTFYDDDIIAMIEGTSETLNISSNESKKDGFSIRSLKDLLIFDLSDMELSRNPSFY